MSFVIGLARRILWGLRWGLIFGAVFDLLALAVFTIGGSSPFDALHTTMPRVLGVYSAGGAIAGVLVGILRPLTKYKTGSAFVGLLAGLIFGQLIALATDSATSDRGEDLFTTIMLAVFLGVPVGLVYREIFVEMTTTKR